MHANPHIDTSIAGLYDPLKKIYITSEPLPGFVLFLFFFLLHHLPNLEHDSHFGTMVRTDKRNPIDGTKPFRFDALMSHFGLNVSFWVECNLSPGISPAHVPTRRRPTRRGHRHYLETVPPVLHRQASFALWTVRQVHDTQQLQRSAQTFSAVAQGYWFIFSLLRAPQLKPEYHSTVPAASMSLARIRYP